MPVEFSKPDEEGRSMYFSDGNLTGGDQLLQEVAGHCGCTVADIEDVYPCTPLQEGMFALTLRDSVAYNVGYKYRLPIGIDTVRLRTAWKRTAETNPILRTRIVPTSERGCMQVVLRRNILWTEKENSETNDERLLADGDNMTNPESPETRVQSVWPAGSPMVKLMWDPVAHDLTVVIHHALCDDWSMAIVLRQVAAAYSGKTLAMRPFRPLIEFIQQAQPDASAFWSTKFHNLSHADVSVFPLHAKAAYVPQPTAILRQKFRQPANSRAEFALNAKVRLAWAVLQWLYTFSSEVLFGAIDSGRAIPLPGIEELSGPALVCVPVYVRLNPSQTVTEALDMVQREWAESMEFEHAGLQNIMRLGAGPAAACRFQTLLTVEPCDAHGLPELFLQQQSLQPVYDTYPLIVRWRSSPQSQSMTIEAMFDPHVLDTRQTERIVHQLAHIYQQIERKPHDVLKELDVCSPADIHDLASWNLPVPTMVQDGVQRLIEQQVQRSPQAMAVHSWNGSLTYHELDTSSSALGVALTHRGVRCRTVVPLCLQRSKWPAIAMIAAMKAGAAFVLLDESYPIARLRQMCKDVKATIVVGTKPTTGLASQLGLDLIAVDELDWEDLPRQRNDCAAAFPHCQGSSAEDLMYITFTSGSTGTPKGVLVSHGGFATSALFHAPKYNFTSSSRVLQFASPGFDSFIIEHLSTLMAGGCVCVPHPDDCRSRLGAVINEFSVNNACLTPTVARVLSADSPTTLLDLTLVGEAATANDVARWPSELHIRNAYGPAECSAVFSVQPHLVPEHPSNIGFPTGGVGWVTDPYDPHRLMPVGSIGELLIEGPIVGPGYASDTDATQRAFINPPVWRERYFGPCPGRMYRTGDLVQSAGDGSFRYVRRKDTQVKLYGQRIELAEIEHHLKTTAFPHASQVVANIVQLQEKPDITPVSLLIAFVCWSDVAQVSKESKRPGIPFLIASEQHRDSCAAGEMQLSAVLPPFMIPRTYLPLDHLPQTVSGKLDRRSLREHASQLTWEDLQSYRSSVKPSKKPQTATESLLQKIWAQVLNIPVDRLSVAENFFHLGGDSVSAMQVAAGCQREGLAVGVAQIFQFPTVEQLAQHAIPIVRETSPRRSSSPTAFHDEVNQTASLGLSSPIQQLFFELCPQGHNRFTQQFLLQVSKPQRASRVREAMESLVARHAILGARFEKLAKVGWSQVVPDGVRPRFSFREHILNGIGNGCMREILENSQNSLDITAGRLVAVDLINTPAHCQYLSLMVHHLVVDLVSWRILLQELEELLTTGALPGPKPMSFQRWCYLQECFVRRSLAPEKALPVEIPPQSLEYWGDDVCAINQNIWADTRQESFTVSEATTRAILGSANEALRTRPVELLHAALVYSFVQAFDDREAPTVFAEGHGREPWDPAMDLSRTVGWFTTMAPLFIRTSRQHDLGTVVQQIKEGRRAIPFNGWAYFASRFLHPEGRERWGDHIPMEILFNYTGLFQQLENPKALLQLAALPDHEILPMAADLPRFALIDASVTVVDGRLSASLIYNRRMQHQGKLHQWVGEYQRTLEELPTALKEYRRFTLSDFPLLSMDSSECLAELMQDIQSRFHIRTQDIEDIYPCSSIQLGIWLSQSKDPRTYWSRLCWSIRPTNPADTMLSPSRVKQAWQQVVDRHPILRTVLLVSPYTDGQPLQVVLRHAVAEIYEQDLKVPSSTAESCQFDDGTMHYSPLGHRLRISVNANGEIPCELVINHLLIDGFTRDILVSDLQLAYDGQLPSFTAAPFSRYLTRLRCQSEADSRAYWTRYLHGVQPCLFPRLDGKLENEQDILHSVTIDFDPLQTQSILRFCEQHATTIASMLQIAWGLVLRAYTGSDSVCFGYMVSARDIPLPGLQEIAGPLINLLVCRLSFDDKDDIHKTISNSQAAYAQNLDHRFCSLTEIIHGLGHTVPRLFNTAMSLQRERVMSPQRAPSVVVQQQGGQDSTEVSF
jgi:amino acid adenylation domain-containing protein/non-ribosomal peptide synthase protein (TIGR01720 family)